MNDTRTGQYSTFYDSDKRGQPAVEELKGVIKYRALIFQLVRRDLISRYKRSALGVAWTMLNPLATMLILTLVFSRLFQTVSGYPIYVLSGLITWVFFSQTSTAALNQNVWGGSLLHKIYLPRTVFTISALGTGLVNLLLSLIPLILIMVAISYPFHISILFLPVPVLILALFTLGLSLIFSTFAIYFPDFVEIYRVLLTAWMYLTPIIYPAEIIPQPYRSWLLHLNPMYYFVEIIRQPIYHGNLPAWNLVFIASIIAVSTLFTGWVLFSRKAKNITYRI